MEAMSRNSHTCNTSLPHFLGERLAPNIDLKVNKLVSNGLKHTMQSEYMPPLPAIDHARQRK